MVQRNPPALTRISDAWKEPLQIRVLAGIGQAPAMLLPGGHLVERPDGLPGRGVHNARVPVPREQLVYRGHRADQRRTIIRDDRGVLDALDKLLERKHGARTRRADDN